MHPLTRVAAGLGAVVGTGVAGLGYARWEAQAYTVRRFDVPVLAPGSAPLRVLHVSDLHIRTDDARKATWIRGLADLAPDVVVNTGDTISDPAAQERILTALEPLAAFPAVFVPGNNDYYEPSRPRWSAYFTSQPRRSSGAPMPFGRLATAMVEQGWVDLTHRRDTLTLKDGRTVFLGGLDDPHLRRARYGRIAGVADADADVRLGVMHSPEPWLLQRFAADAYDLVLAGHTHGGQLRVPFGPPLITNCGIDRARARWLHRWDDDRMWFHVCAGLGTNPYTPIRFACRPEASLLTLVPRAS